MRPSWKWSAFSDFQAASPARAIYGRVISKLVTRGKTFTAQAPSLLALTREILLRFDLLGKKRARQRALR